MKSLSVITLMLATLIVSGFSSCTQVSPQLRAQINSAEAALEAAPAPEALPYVSGSYEHFICSNGYPTTMEIYRNEDLLKRANRNSRVHICLAQQRGRLYVNGQVAADWPVSTGTDGHETPTGTYEVLEMRRDYASNLYGNIRDASGRLVKRNADSTRDVVPEGGTFEGSPMPNWMRLTADGVGMHTGKVKAGRRLSHGCIRLPHVVACMLFDIVELGTPVSIVEDIEPNYPVAEIMAQREIAAAEAALEAQPEELPEDAQ
jgi:lipoprotein-anchoring transpeptidase ErfK/SrfK